MISIIHTATFSMILFAKCQYFDWVYNGKNNPIYLDPLYSTNIGVVAPFWIDTVLNASNHTITWPGQVVFDCHWQACHDGINCFLHTSVLSVCLLSAVYWFEKGGAVPFLRLEKYTDTEQKNCTHQWIFFISNLI